MKRRIRDGARDALPQGWNDLLVQLALFLGCYVAYQLVRAAVAGAGVDPSSRAFDDATRIIGFERLLHIFAEPSVQTWTENRHWLMSLVDLVYLNAHFVVTVGGLVFVYLRRHEAWVGIRNTFLLAMMLALIGYVVFPTAPPRLMPQWGFSDSIHQFTGVNAERGAGSALLNLYAAVPSMHVCFAVMLGVPMARLVRHRTAKLAWIIYPLTISFVVVATGNHYFTDVALGALTATVAATFAHRLARLGAPRAELGQVAA